MLRFGDNGLLKKSKEAVNNSKLAQTEELIKMDLLAAYIDAELAGQEKPSSETIKEIVKKHGGTIDESNPDVIQTPNGEIRLDDVLEDTSSDTQDVDKLNQTIKNLNTKIAELNSQLQTEQSEKTKLQTEINNLNGQVTELNVQIAELKKKAEDGEVTITEKDTQISNLNSQITSKNEEIEEKTNRIEELEANVTTLTEEKNTLQTQITNLNTRIAELEGNQATGDALASDVLTGKTFSTADGVNLTGTMANRGTLNWSPTGSETYDMPAGYYNGGQLSTTTALNNYTDTFIVKHFDISEASNLFNYYNNIFRFNVNLITRPLELYIICLNENKELKWSISLNDDSLVYPSTGSEEIDWESPIKFRDLRGGVYAFQLSESLESGDSLIGELCRSSLVGELDYNK